MHTLTALGYLGCRLAHGAYLCIISLQLLQNDIGTLDNRLGHTRYLCYMDTKGMLAPTLFQLAQEDDLTFDLLDRDVVVLDTREVLLHLVQLVIVRGKERTGPSLGLLVQIFYDGPGYGDAVVGRSTTAQLVEEHQRAWRHII